MKPYIYTISALLLFVSCYNKTSNIITNTIDDKHYLEDITKSWQAIYLDDTSLDAIVGEITKVLYDDGLYFISHKPNPDNSDIVISVYNENGKFMRKISHIGRANNEYLFLKEWDLNTSNNEVLLYDGHTSRLLRYSYMNEFIGSYQLDSSFEQMSYLYTLSDNTFFIQMKILSEGINDLFLYNTNGNSKSLFQNKNIKTDGFMFIPMKTYFSHSNNMNYFSRYFDNNIYSIDSMGNIDHYLKLDFIPTYKKRDLRLISLEDDMRPQSYIANIYNFNKFILIDCREDKLLIDKRDKTITIYKRNMFVGKEIPLNQHIICSYNNYIVGFLNNIDAQNYQELINENTPKEVIEFYKKAAENENATLVLYEIGK